MIHGSHRNVVNGIFDRCHRNIRNGIMSWWSGSRVDNRSSLLGADQGGLLGADQGGLLGADKSGLIDIGLLSCCQIRVRKLQEMRISDYNLLALNHI